MFYQKSLRVVAIVLSLVLVACASEPKPIAGIYSPEPQSRLYGLKQWSLAGRLAISAKQESWSANIEWQHRPDLETIKLSGPLGQGAVLIELSENSVTIDRGKGNVQTSNLPQQFIDQQLGLSVPIKSLRFWALGLPESGRDYQATPDGFVQDGWLVAYKEMRDQGFAPLPHKLSVTDARVKLKLIVDHWDIHGGQAN